MNIRLIIADVDGTLVTPGAGKTTVAGKRLIKAVAQVKKMGKIFSIATARGLDKIEGLVKSLALESPIIVDNGARIYDCFIQKYIFSSYLPGEKIMEILSVTNSFPHNVYLDGVKGRVFFDQGMTPSFKDVIKVVILHITPFEAQEMYESLSKIKDIRVTKSVSGINPVKESIHITNFDTGKDKALHRIADLSGINLENVMAIGDSYNDFSFMAQSGFKVAMGNSVPEIKAIADYIAPSYKEDGVADVLEKLIINQDV